MSNVMALALPEERSELVRLAWTPREVDTLRTTIASQLDNMQLALFVEVCSHLALDPFQKQVYAIVRNTRQQDGSYAKTMVIQIGIDGYRVLAERSGLYAGQSQPFWCGEDGVWRDIWLDKVPPAAAKVDVYRAGAPGPTTAVCRYSSFVQKDKNGNPTGKWADMPDHMLAVRAESHALRRAFPNVMERVKQEVKEHSHVMVELEGYEAPQDQRPVALPALEDGEGWDELPADTMQQLNEYRTAMQQAKTHAQLNTVKAEIDRFGYGEELQDEYMARFREIQPATRQRSA